jgi:peptidoglycan pentaglycine glycine transferase (the first glycine)
MIFSTLNELHHKQYDTYVKSHPRGSFLQSWQWGEWQEQLGLKAERMFVKNSDEDILVAGQLILMKVPKLKWDYLYFPYGPLFDEQLSERDRKEILNFLLKELRLRHPKALATRIEPKQTLSLEGQETVHIQPGKTLIIDLNKSTEQLLLEMHHKTRYNIKVAQKHGVIVSSETKVTPGHGLHLEECLNLLLDTAKRQQFRSHAPAYYRKFIDFFLTHPGECQLVIYKALYENKLVATALMIDYGPTRTYLFGGTSASHKNVMAPYALHWQAMRDAQSQGLTQYDFWGIETATGKTSGFVDFKLRWGGQPIEYPPARDFIHRPLWYNLYELLRSLNRKF